MKIVDKLSELKKKQKEILNSFEEIMDDAEKSSNMVENEKLKNDLEKLNKDFDSLEKKYKNILDQNQKIKQSLNEQILDEKLNILKISKHKLELYFGRIKEKYDNNLTLFENEIKLKINKFKQMCDKNLFDNKQEVIKDINKLEISLSEKIKIQRGKLKKEEEELFQNIKSGMAEFSGKKIDDETVQKRIKQNKIEMKIGLSWLNKIGMVLIIIAIGITAYYNKENVNNYIKGILFFMLGIVSIGVGEYFYRKQKQAFAIGILGGGIAILYSAIFFSYFVLKENGVSIIDTNTAIILSAIVSLTVIVLSIRYDSKIIISFGLIGGYLPFLSYIAAFGFKGYEFYYAMAYLFTLNLIVLIISFLKQWRITNYISFLFNVPSLIYLINYAENIHISLAYTALTFVMYLIIIIAYPLLNKKNLKIPDLILLAANTFISSLLIFLLFKELKWTDYQGALALAFCLVYMGLGYFANKVMKNEKGTIIIFYLTSLTFAVLMMPFHFGRNWFLLGWLVEGTLLTVFGYKKNLKPLEIAGWAIFALCIVTFYAYDFTQGMYSTLFFKLKYFFVTLSSVLILVIYQLDLFKNKFSEFSFRGKFIKGFKYFTVITTYIFLISITFHYYDKAFKIWNKLYDIIPYDIADFFKAILFAVITMSYGQILKKTKFIFDKAVNVMSIILFIIADIFCFYLILYQPLLSYSIFSFSQNTLIHYLALAILIIYNIMIIINLHNLISSIINYFKSNLEMLPLWIGIILLGNITGLLTRQMNLYDVSIYIGFSYLVLAVLAIIYGFWKKFLYIRFFGLALTFISLIILFLKIFLYADTPGKIISFFGFGVILILISFIYQAVNKNLNRDEEGPAKKRKKGEAK